MSIHHSGPALTPAVLASALRSAFKACGLISMGAHTDTSEAKPTAAINGRRRGEDIMRLGRHLAGKQRPGSIMHTVSVSLVAPRGEHGATVRLLSGDLSAAERKALRAAIGRALRCAVTAPRM